MFSVSTELLRFETQLRKYTEATKSIYRVYIHRYSILND
jgi:hypothetical protein